MELKRQLIANYFHNEFFIEQDSIPSEMTPVVDLIEFLSDQKKKGATHVLARYFAEQIVITTATVSEEPEEDFNKRVYDHNKAMKQASKWQDDLDFQKYQELKKKFEPENKQS